MICSRAFLKTATLILFCAVVTGLGFTPAFADKIEFGDGNVLQGTVSSFEKDAVIFSTSYAKKVKIPVDQIKTISTDKAVTLKMTNDSVLRGKLTTLDDGKVAIILEPVGKTVPFEWGQIKHINKPPGSWSGNFSLGGTIQTGNVERVNITGGFDAKREWEHDRFKIRFLHNYAEDNKEITSRNTFGALKLDHFFTENFFTGLSIELLKDKFKDVNLRAIMGGGFGYRFWNDSVKTLEVELGVTYFSEDLVVGPDDQFAAGRVGVTYSYKLLENLLFNDYLLYYPSFEDPKEYRLRNEASLISQLGMGWSLKISHIFDQNSDPTPGIEDKDHLFIFAIQYTF
jgi:putative salt-induced outer membrane protein YdiY